MKVFISTLGCPRNEVDSEIIAGILKEDGHSICKTLPKADAILINTCAFIEPAIEESIDAILEASKLKKKVIVAGCLPQRYGKKLLELIPEIDCCIGINQIPKISDILSQIKSAPTKKCFVDKPSCKVITFLPDHTFPRYRLNSTPYAYLKISEGCNNKCTYCVIPYIRGNYRSRTIESCLKEAKELKSQGVKELILVAMDTTLYGTDLYGISKLPELLRKLSDIGFEWIRLLYTHPAHFTEELVYTIKEVKPICKYIDIPIQHISNKILTAMGRNTSSESLQKLIDRLREQIPETTLRTTIIVGFPGEEESDFLQLYKFLEQTKFDRLGIFPYYREIGTPAYKIKNHIKKKIKMERYEKLYSLQSDIMHNKNDRLIGTRIKVLIDRKTGKNEFEGRTESDAPDIDQIVHLRGDFKVGEFTNAYIKDVSNFELFA